MWCCCRKQSADIPSDSSSEKLFEKSNHRFFHLILFSLPLTITVCHFVFIITSDSVKESVPDAWNSAVVSLLVYSSTTLDVNWSSKAVNHHYRRLNGGGHSNTRRPAHDIQVEGKKHIAIIWTKWCYGEPVQSIDGAIFLRVPCNSVTSETRVLLVCRHSPVIKHARSINLLRPYIRAHHFYCTQSSQIPDIFVCTVSRITHSVSPCSLKYYWELSGVFCCSESGSYRTNWTFLPVSLFSRVERQARCIDHLPPNSHWSLLKCGECLSLNLVCRDIWNSFPVVSTVYKARSRRYEDSAWADLRSMVPMTWNNIYWHQNVRSGNIYERFESPEVFLSSVRQLIIRFTLLSSLLRFSMFLYGNLRRQSTGEVKKMFHRELLVLT